MVTEKCIDLNPTEIQMIRTLCNDTVSLKQQNSDLAQSILEKVSFVEKPIVETLIMKRLGRHRKVILLISEPDPIQVNEIPLMTQPEQDKNPVISCSVENQPEQCQISDKPEQNPEESNLTSYPEMITTKTNFFQHLLKKLLSAVRQ